jgi:RHS repeat-associated protein
VFTGLRTGSVYRWVVTATDNVNNVVTATATVVVAQATKTYYFGSMRVAVRSTGGGLVWLHSDHLSSVSAATDQSGQVVSRQLFAPYGELRGEVGVMAGSWGWATHRQAEDTGLVFMRARWYSMYASRFVLPDPVPDGAGTGLNYARYDYAKGNPVRLNDPTGHDVGCAGRDAGACGYEQQMQTMGITTQFVDALTPSATATPEASPVTTSGAETTATAQPTPAAASPSSMSSKGWISPFGKDVGYKVTWDFDQSSRSLDAHDQKIHDGIDLVSINDSDKDVENSRAIYAVHDLTFEWKGDDSKTSEQGLLNMYYLDESGTKVWVQYTHVKVTNKDLLNATSGKTVIPRGTKIGYYGAFGSYGDFIHFHLTVKRGAAKEHRDNMQDPKVYLP